MKQTKSKVLKPDSRGNESNFINLHNLNCKDSHSCNTLGEGESLLRAPQFIARLDISRSKFYKMLQAGDLPTGFWMSTGVRVWLNSDVNKFIAEIAAKPATVTGAV